MNKLRTGIIGIGGFGTKVLTELGKNELYHIIAIADQSIELAKDYALQYEAIAYDDYRLLIVQEKLDVLFLTLPTFLCGEYIHIAAKAGIHVLKPAPLARTLPEAMQWVEMMEKAQKNFQIMALNRYAPGFLLAHQLLQDNHIGPVYLVRAECFMNFLENNENFDWRGDPILAGGGVLLEQAYHLLDMITWNLGAPEKLYSLNTNRCSKRVLPPYRTEDTAVLTMHFASGAMGNILCSWMTGPPSQRIFFHGAEGSIETGINSLRIYNPEGKVTREESWQDDEASLIARQISHFAAGMSDPQIKPVNNAREHLSNVAIIESAYLSARTQSPETLTVYGSLFKL
ncbi:MAG: Gfo/Idh/MocA family oxidoreductase [Sedimentisphaerales bacterium]|nr:Gfo/Idh/MocA family oxidoreductase [Sedimentisphaerales bacterium]